MYRIWCYILDILFLLQKLSLRHKKTHTFLWFKCIAALRLRVKELVTYFRYWSQTAIRSNNVHVSYFLKICWYMTPYMHICDPTTNSLMWCQKMALASAASLNCSPSWLTFAGNKAQPLSKEGVGCQRTGQPLLPSTFAGVSLRRKKKSPCKCRARVFGALSQHCLSFSHEGTLRCATKWPPGAKLLLWGVPSRRGVWLLRSTCQIDCSCDGLYCSRLHILSRGHS